MYCPLCGLEVPIVNHEREEMGSGKIQVLYDVRCDYRHCVEYGNLVTVVYHITRRAGGRDTKEGREVYN